MRLSEALRTTAQIILRTGGARGPAGPEGPAGPAGPASGITYVTSPPGGAGSYVAGDVIFNRDAQDTSEREPAFWTYSGSPGTWYKNYVLYPIVEDRLLGRRQGAGGPGSYDEITIGAGLDLLAYDLRIDTTWFDARVATAVAAVVDAAPGSLDTLNELAAALGDDANFAATVTASIATKLTSPGFASAAQVRAGTVADRPVAPDALQASAAFQTLTDAAPTDWDMSLGYNAKWTLGANRTLSTPTNPKEGLTYSLHVIQDGTGNRTVTWPAAFDWGSAGAPTLSTGASKRDIIMLQCIDAATPTFRAALFSKAA
jgi:hypothetical protein